MNKKLLSAIKSYVEMKIYGIARISTWIPISTQAASYVY